MYENILNRNPVLIKCTFLPFETGQPAPQAAAHLLTHCWRLNRRKQPARHGVC